MLKAKKSCYFAFVVVFNYAVIFRGNVIFIIFPKDAYKKYFI